MRLKNVLRLGVVTLLVTTGLAVPHPASADVVPVTHWSTDIAGHDAQTVLSHSDGGLTLGCDNAANLGFRSFNAAGVATQNQPLGTTTVLDACGYKSAIGADGTFFAAALTGTNFQTSLIRAYKANRLVWSYILPCKGRVYDMEMAINGNVHVLVGEMSPPCAGSAALIALTPTAQSGGVPTVALNKVVDASAQPNGLSVYNGGLVIRTARGYQYVVGTAVKPAVNVNAGGSYGFAAYPNSGRAYLPVLADPGEQSACGNNGSYIGGLRVYEPSGFKWTYDLPACSRVWEIRPTPNGGVVVHYEAPLAGGERQRYVDAVGPAGGARLWQRRYDVVRDTGAAFGIAVDLNGNVALHQGIVVYGDSKYTEGHFSLLSGVTGAVLQHLAMRSNYGSPADPSYIFASSAPPAIAKNTAYVLAARCATDFWSCNPATTKLYAFKVPGLAMDYPRGAVLQWNTPWLNYAALGDSFSSGEGVPAFESGTNTAGPSENRCHRSTQAYAKLLNNTLGSRLRLGTVNGRSAFVACSGAETKHLTERWPENPADGSSPKNLNEPRQIEVITPTTDLVTVTIGGNDVGFAELAEACVLNLVSCEVSAAYARTASKLEHELPAGLKKAFTGIKQKLGPKARVLVIGYPMMVPGTDVSTRPTCPYLEPNEKVATRDVIRQLNQKLEQHVAWINGPELNPKFHYVDPNYPGSPFEGHGLCLGDSYFNSVQVPVEYSMHPNAKGQDAYRQVVLHYLGNL